jgi:hypothetical protein
VSAPRVASLADGSVAAGWRLLAIVVWVLVVGMVLLLGMLMASRRRAEERRQLEVPPFSAEAFQRFCDRQQWVAQQPVPPPADRPNWSSPPVSGKSVPPVSGKSVPPVSGKSVPPVSGKSVPPVSGKSVPPVSGRWIPPAAR